MKNPPGPPPAYEDPQRTFYDAVERAEQAKRDLLAPYADLDVDDCPGCEGGRAVRYCPIHGLQGTHPR